MRVSEVSDGVGSRKEAVRRRAGSWGQLTEVKYPMVLPVTWHVAVSGTAVTSRLDILESFQFLQISSGRILLVIVVTRTSEATARSLTDQTNHISLFRSAQFRCPCHVTTLAVTNFVHYR